VKAARAEEWSKAVSALGDLQVMMTMLELMREINFTQVTPCDFRCCSSITCIHQENELMKEKITYAPR